MGKNIIYVCEICGAEMTSETIYQLHASKCIKEEVIEEKAIEEVNPIVDPDLIKDPIKTIPTPRKVGK